MTQGFDPAAATAAYLAQLSPEGHAKATAYTQGGHWLLLWGVLVSVLVAWLVLKSGLLARVEGQMERKKPRLWATAFMVTAVFSLVSSILTLPWSIYAGWWREKAYGLTSQPFVGWLKESGISMLIGAVMAGILMMVLYAVIRRAPKTWWAWAGGVTAVFFIVTVVLSPIFIEPIFNKYTPAPNGPVRDTVVAMAKKAGVPSDKIYIYNGSKQSNRYTANVSGLFGSARVAMSDVMFQKDADLAEVKGVVGHEMGHYAHMHILWFAGIMSLLSIIGFWLVSRLFAPTARLLGVGGMSISDPAGLPVISIILSVLSLLAMPITNTLTRTTEADADSFSLQLVNEPDGLAKALVKTIEYRASSPSTIEEVIFYDHPSVEHRVRKAMDWKATHPKTGD